MANVFKFDHVEVFFWPIFYLSKIKRLTCVDKLRKKGLRILDFQTCDQFEQNIEQKCSASNLQIIKHF